ncbi:TetR/AcrR family transcriptional regulator [Rothia sp. P7208]|uniref:TetR/AcrR family transcriptional regulator n=1 Tax=Rothia sp. P7208 TaxID=3402660 RepID=UPI003AC11C0E
MKKVQRSDRRVRKTQSALYLALADLLQHKKLSSITVSELAEKADIHRATFYSHYSDISELYSQIQETALLELSSILDPDPVNGKNMNSREVFGAFMQFIQGNKEVCRMLLTQRGAGSFFEVLSNRLEREYIDIFWSSLKDVVPAQQLSLFANYHLQGCLAVFTMWAQQGYETPAEIITSTLATIDTHYDKLLNELSQP